ncbi:MAG: hypothetical protein ABIO39_07235, partial [Caulobacteraceae bacterium]
GRTYQVSLPPIGQFREGDSWAAYSAEASAKAGVSAMFPFRRANGAWEGTGIDAMSQPRTFQEVHSPLEFSATAPEGTHAATPDGRLFHFAQGKWSETPIGSSLTTPNGSKVTIDTRVTQEEATALAVRLLREGLIQAEARENGPAGAQARADARIDALKRGAERGKAAADTRLAAESAPPSVQTRPPPPAATAPPAQAAAPTPVTPPPPAQEAAPIAVAAPEPPPNAVTPSEPATSSNTTTIKAPDQNTGGLIVLALVFLAVAGSWVWWFFRARNKAPPPPTS